MHEIQLRVRFGETDALGHINNSSFFAYFEEARMRFFEHMGFEIEREVRNVIVASTKCDFKKQGFFNQRLKIQTYISRIGTKSYTMEHEIYCVETNNLIAKGNAVVVCFDFENQRSIEIPDVLREKLRGEMIDQ